MVSYSHARGLDKALKLSKKQKRKNRSKIRKSAKKEAALISRASFALENNLVRNLTDIVIPAFSIAVLSYGAGWIPSPRFNVHQFRLDGMNAANKQEWAAVFNAEEHEPVDLHVPLSLLKKPFTTP